MKKFSEIWLQLHQFVHYEIVYFLLYCILSRLTVVSHTAKSSRSACCKTNDAPTTHEDFTGTNVVQIRLACNPPSTNAVTLKLQTLTHHVTSNYHTNTKENPCLWSRDQGCQLQRTSLVSFFSHVVRRNCTNSLKHSKHSIS